jgi:hypothetical protein
MTTASISDPILTDYVGLDDQAGVSITGVPYLMQALRILIGTPIGSRVMRRTFGTLVPMLVDAPMTPDLVADLTASVAQAIVMWLPLITLLQVQVVTASAGKWTMNLVIEENGQPLKLVGVV